MHKVLASSDSHTWPIGNAVADYMDLRTLRNFTLSRRAFTGALGASALASNAGWAVGSRHDRAFKVYGALLHSGEPDLRPYGVNPIYLFDRGIWSEGTSQFSPPDPDVVAGKIARLPDDGAPLVLDFEFFKLRSQEEAIKSREALRQIAETFGRFANGRPIGIYDYLPRRNYWDSLKPLHSPSFKEWQDLNTLMSPLESSVDVLFPSLYTFHDNPRQWQRYARAQVREARRISDKPVIPFIWPDFHYNGKAGPLEAISRAFWRLQLDTLAEIADGIVIWGGWDPSTRKRVMWNDNAPWWVETRLFLRDIPQQSAG